MKKGLLFTALLSLSVGGVNAESSQCDPNDLRCFQETVIQNADCLNQYHTTVTDTTADAYRHPDKTHEHASYDGYAWIEGEFVTQTVGGYYINSCLKCHKQEDLRAAMNGITDIDEGVQYLESSENSPFREVTYCVNYESGTVKDPGRGWYIVSATDTCPIDEDTNEPIGELKTFYLRHSMANVRSWNGEAINPLNFPKGGIGANDSEFRYYVQLMIEGVDGF